MDAKSRSPRPYFQVLRPLAAQAGPRWHQDSEKRSALQMHLRHYGFVSSVEERWGVCQDGAEDAQNSENPERIKQIAPGAPQVGSQMARKAPPLA